MTNTQRALLSELREVYSGGQLIRLLKEIRQGTNISWGGAVERLSKQEIRTIRTEGMVCLQGHEGATAFRREHTSPDGSKTVINDWIVCLDCIENMLSTGQKG